MTEQPVTALSTERPCSHERGADFADNPSRFRCLDCGEQVVETRAESHPGTEPTTMTGRALASKGVREGWQSSAMTPPEMFPAAIAAIEREAVADLRASLAAEVLGLPSGKASTRVGVMYADIDVVDVADVLRLIEGDTDG